MKYDELLRLVADAAIDVLNDRGGFDGWWDNIDEKTQEEILDEVGKAVLMALAASQTEIATAIKAVFDERS